jgi:hypothetical protein
VSFAKASLSKYGAIGYAAVGKMEKKRKKNIKLSEAD